MYTNPSNKLEKLIPLSIILVGFTAIVTQIVLMRELFIVLYGNEISIGFIFASWFIAAAMGSWFLGRFADRLRQKIGVFSLCQFLLSILLPLSIFAVRSIKLFLNLDAGQLMPLLPMFLSSFIILAPICILFGFMFSLGSRIYKSASPVAATKVGRVYILEASGSLIGGILVSFILIRLLHSLQIIVILSMLNLLAALLLQRFSEKAKTKPLFIAILTFLLTLVVLTWLFSGWDRLEQYSLKMQWRRYELLSSRNSIYGNIVVTKRNNQHSFFYNGLHLYTVPNELISEEAVHFALLEHPQPKEVLLIGGGAGGLIKEILKHPVKKIDYVELDPLLIQITKKYLPKDEYDLLQDPRIEISNLDGRLFIKRTDNKYDCVIVHLGDPFTAQLNRYYTVEFFQEIKRILKEKGILSFALASSESYIGLKQRDFLSSIYVTLKEAFKDIKVIPGDTAYFLACDKTGVLTYDYKILEARIKERKVDAKYVRQYYLFSKLSPEKINYTENAIRQNNTKGINFDFRPISYYYNLIFWSAHFRDSFFKKILEAADEKGIWQIILGICAFVLLFWLIRAKKNKLLYTEVVLMAVSATGFTQMAVQVIILLSFQILYGYVFYKLGIIITSFMLGLTLGGLWIVKIMPGIKKDLTFFIWMHLGICIYPLLFATILFWLSITKIEVAPWIGLNILFPLLPAVSAFMGGAQFSLANKIYLGEKKEIGRVAGLTYGLDLLGSSLGAFLTAVFLIPLLGIIKTCLLITATNVTILIILFFSSFHRPNLR